MPTMGMLQWVFTVESKMADQSVSERQKACQARMIFIEILLKNTPKILIMIYGCISNIQFNGNVINTFQPTYRDTVHMVSFLLIRFFLGKTNVLAQIFSRKIESGIQLRGVMEVRRRRTDHASLVRFGPKLFSSIHLDIHVRIPQFRFKLKLMPKVA